ncbi:hypothetical protein [Pseudoalteromonas lipolytica]|uniref:Anti-bacteriophage protein A/HamA C-terminal domain-containing protein n=1 Tax=Pseudoalteromonas lipolytica TaxID=570156 RepID=A0ABU8SVM2_9GAMM
MSSHIKNSVIEVRVVGENPHSSSGIIFNALGSSSTHVLTSKHSVCSKKTICEIAQPDNNENKCKKCTAPIDRALVELDINENNSIASIFQSPTADIALLKLTESEDATELQIGNFESDHDTYHSYDRHGDYMVFDSPSVSDNGYVSLNIKSNVTANLREKTESLRGRSGSPVLRIVSQTKYELVGIVTDEEKINSIGVEELTPVLLEQLGHHNGNKLFSEKSFLLDSVDAEFIADKFELINEYDISGCSLLVYCPKFTNEFLYEEIAKYLVERLFKTLSTPREFEASSDINAKFFKAASEFLADESSFISKLSLLEAITESSLIAPKVYSQFENSEDYHSIHLKEIASDKFEFIFTKFYSENSLAGCIVNGLKELCKLDISNVVSSSLISEHFLQSKLKEEHANVIANLLLPGSTVDYKSSLATMLTWKPKISSETKQIDFYSERFTNVSREIIEEIDHELSTLQTELTPLIKKGTSLHLFLLPINRQGQLKDLMKRTLGYE